MDKLAAERIAEILILGQLTGLDHSIELAEIALVIP
jgi:hypothetical protein